MDQVRQRMISVKMYIVSESRCVPPLAMGWPP